MIKDINDFVFHDQQTKDRVMMLIESPAIFPSSRKGIILYGEYGCGKTTLARLLPDAIDLARGSTFSFGMDLEFACSSTKYRSQLSEVDAKLNANLFRPVGVKFILFDEFDNYGDKQKEFKSIMTSPHIGFFITTNYIEDISPSIVSRCHTIELKQPPPVVWESYATSMFAQRNVAIMQAEIQQAISASRTYSQRDVTATLEILLYQKTIAKSAA